MAQTSHTQLLTDPLEPLSKSFAEIASPSGSLSLVPADDSTESHAASFMGVEVEDTSRTSGFST